jgi:hypothetical protein
MSDEGKSEIDRREEARAHAGDIVAGSGQRGNPRRMAQMVSARLDGELVAKLRAVAEQRNLTLSELLREGAELIVRDEYADMIRLEITKVEGLVGTTQRGHVRRVVAPNHQRLPRASTTTTMHEVEPAKAY